jgi:uncharacterized RDD family membrane protein YckC
MKWVARRIAATFADFVIVCALLVIVAPGGPPNVDCHDDGLCGLGQGLDSLARAEAWALGLGMAYLVVGALVGGSVGKRVLGLGVVAQTTERPAGVLRIIGRGLVKWLPIAALPWAALLIAGAADNVTDSGDNAFLFAAGTAAAVLVTLVAWPLASRSGRGPADIVAGTAVRHR